VTDVFDYSMFPFTYLWALLSPTMYSIYSQTRCSEAIVLQPEKKAELMAMTSTGRGEVKLVRYP
jgi:hypothetical protein